MNEIILKTESASYPILISNGLIHHTGRIIRERELFRGNKIAILSSELVLKLYAEAVSSSFAGTGLDVGIIKIPDGEGAKELHVLDDIYNSLLRYGLNRDSMIISLGGGSVSDVAGFAASSFMRGIDYINIPTTLLAQIDSSIGGKTGINHSGGKNIVGAFYHPKAVFIDPEVLSSLDQGQLRSGIAELIKTAVIGDGKLFELIEIELDGIIDLNDKKMLGELIESAVRVKVVIVELDERETKGIRQKLNFGHTYGHAYESLLNSGEIAIQHGEAVAIGMITESILATVNNILAEDDCQRIHSLCKRIVDASRIKELSWGEVSVLLRIDKKVTDAGLFFALPRKIGEVELVGDLPENLLEEAFERTIAGG